MSISVRTLQYYDRIGLLKPAEIKENGYRVYDEKSVKQLEEILRYESAYELFMEALKNVF